MVSCCASTAHLHSAPLGILSYPHLRVPLPLSSLPLCDQLWGASFLGGTFTDPPARTLMKISASPRADTAGPTRPVAAEPSATPDMAHDKPNDSTDIEAELAGGCIKPPLVVAHVAAAGTAGSNSGQGTVTGTGVSAKGYANDGHEAPSSCAVATLREEFTTAPVDGCAADKDDARAGTHLPALPDALSAGGAPSRRSETAVVAQQGGCTELDTDSDASTCRNCEIDLDDPPGKQCDICRRRRYCVVCTFRCYNTGCLKSVCLDCLDDHELKCPFRTDVEDASPEAALP